MYAEKKIILKYRQFGRDETDFKGSIYSIRGNNSIRIYISSEKGSTLKGRSKFFPFCITLFSKGVRRTRRGNKRLQMFSRFKKYMTEFLPGMFCLLNRNTQRGDNVVPTSMQRPNVTSALVRRCISVIHVCHWEVFGQSSRSEQCKLITKTRLFKYIENFTSKKLKIFR